MAVFDDDAGAPPVRRVAHEIGQDLSRLSVDELAIRIEALKAETARLEAEIGTKSAQLQAADQLFRR